MSLMRVIVVETRASVSLRHVLMKKTGALALLGAVPVPCLRPVMNKMRV
jgi:hypothetical protein